MLKVAAFTGGKNVPSARFRVRQYILPLSSHGIQVDEKPALLGTYPPPNKVIRPFWATASLCSRAFDVADSRNYDLCWLQREMLSTYLTLEPLTKNPRVLDVDDAIWLHRGGEFAKRLAELCEIVVCGNSHIAEVFSQWNSKVAVLPTPVDTTHYFPVKSTKRDDLVTIGWIGTSGGFKYLDYIEPALRRVLSQHPNVQLLIVSDRRPSLSTLPQQQLQYIPWTSEQEVGLIQEMDIGIMPLLDTPWERGKCSFKMLTYMACGVPVVVSDIGMNAEVLSMGRVGVAASSLADWEDALSLLIKDPALARRLGENGSSVVHEHYSVEALLPKLASILKSVAG